MTPNELSLVIDTAPRELATNPQPGYLETIEDPYFGTLVTRITNPLQPVGFGIEGEWEEVSRHGYRIRQPWNADESLLIMDKGYSGRGDLVLDGRTYEPKFARDEPGSERRWHPHEPNLRVWCGGAQIGLYDIVADKASVLKTFDGYDSFRFHKGNITPDGRLVAVDGNDETVGFVFDLETLQKGPDFDLSGITLSWIGVSPLGNYVIVHESSSRESRGDVYTIYDRDRKELWRSTDYGLPSHYDLAVVDGVEYLVGIAKTEFEDGAGQTWDTGTIFRRRLSDGMIDLVLNPHGGYCSEISCRSTDDPRWAFGSYNDNPKHPPYRNETVRVPLDGSGAVARLSSTHRHKADYGSIRKYDSEPHACPDPSGRRIIWASNWDGENPVACFITEFGHMTGAPRPEPQPEPTPAPQPQPQPRPESEPMETEEVVIEVRITGKNLRLKQQTLEAEK